VPGLWRSALALVALFAGDGRSGVALAAQTPNPRATNDTVPVRLDGGRFSVIAEPKDVRLARSLLGSALAHDTFPGLPRPRAHVLISIAPDAKHFQAWSGPAAPEWGAAVAFPDAQRVIVQGGSAPSTAGDPISTLRHELAHLALHEYLGDVPPRWFDEGYAMYAEGGPGRDDILATNVALALRGVPTLASLDTGLVGTEGQASVSYALAYRAVSDLAHLDPDRGLTLLFRYWRESGSLDVAVRRAYGEPLDTFESAWRTHTRHRYGALALLSDLSFATVVFLGLLTPLYLARRRRDRVRLEALREAEAVADRIRLEAALSGNVPPRDGGPDGLRHGRSEAAG
jgi:hypothetical protein